MDDMIRGLDDSQAVRVLTTFARVRLRAGGVAETEWTPELDRALRQDFPAEADAGRAASVSEGDLARQALLLLADDPQNRDALAALIEGPPPESYEVVTAGTVALVAAMLVVLQTHVLFERDRDGKIHIKIEKKPTRDSLLKDLVQKLFGFFPANYHQLGMIAQERRDFASAEQWYRKSLAIKEKQGDEHGAAIAYGQLGTIAQEQCDFASAEQWYRKSLAIFEKQGNEHSAAITYHRLGMIAQEQRDFASAEQWYRKSLAIEEKQGDEHGDESVAFAPESRGIDVEDATSMIAERGEALAPATPVPAEIATQAQARPAPGGDVDAVDCTVFAPPAAAAGDSILVQLFAHTAQQADDAIHMAREFDESARRLGFSSLELEIPRGSRLQVELALPGLEIDESVQYIVWRGRAVSVQFAVTVPPAQVPGNLIGKVTVYLQGAPIGHIRFKIQITARRPRMATFTPPPGEPATGPQPLIGGTGEKPEPQPLGDEACRYKQAFVSYAMKDLNEVMKRVQMLERLHVSFFQDLLDLEPGERWERKLYQHIDDCDVFMLFWSTASKESKWVTKEVQYALARKGGDDSRPPEIVPVLIEGPPVPLPNPELAHLHFNDKLLYYMRPLQS